ncbi:hypothetical protein LP417_01505 [Polaromonas sp. P1-6]|nr:hypothetical protein LP417_01505 [Polaromonas sp. P1-6]
MRDDLFVAKAFQLLGGVPAQLQQAAANVCRIQARTVIADTELPLAAFIVGEVDRHLSFRGFA